jgi:hypothetical protein
MDEMVKTGAITPGITPDREAKLHKMRPQEVPVEEYLKRAGLPDPAAALDDDVTKRAADRVTAKLQ